MDIIHRVMPTILSAFNSICEILGPGCSIIDIERRIHEAGHQISRELLTSLLADIDRSLMEARNKAEWEVVGPETGQLSPCLARSPSSVDCIGTGREGEYRILLDEALGWNRKCA